MSARVATAMRNCECCGEQFGRRRFPSGQLERVSQFAERRFCSRVCYRKASADGGRLQPPGVWISQPYALEALQGVSGEANPQLPTRGGYPWDRQRRPSARATTGQVLTSRQEPNPGASA